MKISTYAQIAFIKFNMHFGKTLNNDGIEGAYLTAVYDNSITNNIILNGKSFSIEKSFFLYEKIRTKTGMPTLTTGIQE